jgi:hypothetical protein
MHVIIRWGVYKSWVARGKDTQAAVGVAVHNTHTLYDIKKDDFFSLDNTFKEAGHYFLLQ